MASSSLSQEDFDHDFELSTRRSRVRTARANARNVPPSRTGIDATGISVDAEGTESGAGHGAASSAGLLESGDVNLCVGGIGTVDHDASPKPSSRAKDKRCPRPNHVNKGKAQRERRKLREKRRSTGVVHLPSTESTGGSTGEDEDELLLCAETRRNTSYNEMPLDKEQHFHETASNQTRVFSSRINKSPSDLDADDEDNQEYDSAVNQSDSTMSLVQDGERSSSNISGRPVTPCSENLEELLERAQKENRRLLELVKQKDDKITILEQKVNSLIKDMTITDGENKKLREENRALLSALVQEKRK